MYFDLYQMNARLAVKLQATGASPELVAHFQAVAENWKRLAIQGLGGSPSMPIAGAIGGTAAITTLKPPTVSADVPQSVRPLAELSSRAVPQVQTATVRGVQVGVAVAVSVPAAAGVGAVGGHAAVRGGIAAVRAAPQAATAVQQGLAKGGELATQAATAAGGVAARYIQQLSEFVDDAVEGAMSGSGPLEAFVGAGAGKALNGLKGPSSGPKKSLGRRVDDFISMMSGGSGRSRGGQRHTTTATPSGTAAADAARAAVASVPKKLFKAFDCTKCASAIVEQMKARGITGELLNIRANGGADFIASDFVKKWNDHDNSKWVSSSSARRRSRLRQLPPGGRTLRSIHQVATRPSGHHDNVSSILEPMNIIQLLEQLRQDPAAIIEPVDPHHLGAFLAGYKEVNSALADPLRSLVDRFHGPSSANAFTRAYLRLEDREAIGRLVQGLIDILGTQKTLVAKAEMIVPPVDLLVREAQGAGRIGMILGEPTILWFANYVRGFLIALSESDPPGAEIQRLRIMRFEKWLQTRYEEPETPWHRIVRAYHGPCIDGVLEFAKLWVEHENTTQ